MDLSLQGIIDAVNMVLAWLNAEPAAIQALVVSLVLTEGIKQVLLPRITSPATQVAHVRLVLRGTAFLTGLLACLFLWAGDLRHGFVWGLIVGAGSPIAYQVLVAWGLGRGYEWAKRLQAQDAILRRHKLTAEQVEQAEEGTVLGAAKRKP